MQFRFAHNNFNVRDLERSLKFYDEALGLKEVAASTPRTAASPSSTCRTARRRTSSS